MYPYAEKIAVEFERQVVRHTGEGSSARIMLPAEILKRGQLKIGDTALVGVIKFDDEIYVTIRRKPDDRCSEGEGDPRPPE